MPAENFSKCLRRSYCYIETVNNKWSAFKFVCNAGTRLVNAVVLDLNIDFGPPWTSALMANIVFGYTIDLLRKYMTTYR